MGSSGWLERSGAAVQRSMGGRRWAPAAALAAAFFLAGCGPRNEPPEVPPACTAEMVRAVAPEVIKE